MMRVRLGGGKVAKANCGGEGAGLGPLPPPPPPQPERRPLLYNVGAQDAISPRQLSFSGPSAKPTLLRRRRSLARAEWDSHKGGRNPASLMSRCQRLRTSASPSLTAPSPDTQPCCT